MNPFSADARPVGIVAGSGIDLRTLLDDILQELPFEAFPEIPRGQVPGHRCQFVLGHCGGVPVALQEGRLHLYEGWPLETVTAPVSWLHSLGVRQVVFTNACGSLHAHLPAGSLVTIDRVIACPWRGAADALPQTLNPDFVLQDCAFRGAYCWVHGPCYETRAEIEALRRMGADVVGMSTLPELAACARLGMQAGVVSCVTNACGSAEKLTHQQVLDAARKASLRLSVTLRTWLTVTRQG